MSQPRIVNCPTCDQAVPWTEKSKFRPFCSKRCKLIDFGDWANEKNTIAGDPIYLNEDESDEKLQ